MSLPYACISNQVVDATYTLNAPANLSISDGPDHWKYASYIWPWIATMNIPLLTYLCMHDAYWMMAYFMYEYTYLRQNGCGYHMIYGHYILSSSFYLRPLLLQQLTS